MLQSKVETLREPIWAEMHEHEVAPPSWREFVIFLVKTRQPGGKRHTILLRQPTYRQLSASSFGRRGQNASKCTNKQNDLIWQKIKIESG